MEDNQALILKASSRTDTGKKVQALRKKSLVPAVVYGHNKDNQNVEVRSKELETIYSTAGDSTLIDLAVDNQAPIKVLFHDVSRDIISNVIQHVDFYIVNMSEEINAEIVLIFQGEADAVKKLGGTLVKNKDHISIKCLPQNLIGEMDIDISLLKTFEDVIHVSDIPFPDTITILDDPDQVIAIVTPPRSEEELAQLEETVSEDVSAVAGAAETAPADEGEETGKKTASAEDEKLNEAKK